MNLSLTPEPGARNVRADAFVAQMHQAERAALAEAIGRRDVAELERAAIARRIREARKEAGLSQPEMADAIGVIPRTYQNYESIKEPRTPWALIGEIAKVTGKTTEWLIHGDKARTPDLLDGNGSQLDRIEGLLTEIRDSLSPPKTKARAATKPAFPKPEAPRRLPTRKADQPNTGNQ